MFKEILKTKLSTVEIFIGNNILLSLIEKEKTNLFLIIDDTVFNLYHDILTNLPNLLGIYKVTPGEESKSFDTYKDIIEKISLINLKKDDTVLAIGGGVVTDLAGFVASTYKRGINLINVPTTLIGMVDASIGGKCGINFNTYKNQIGNIYQPKKIIIDLSFLKTLPEEIFIAGFSEIIKIAFTSSYSLYEKLNNCKITEIHDEKFLLNIIRLAVKAKIKYVEIDEFDQNERKILNFGHTIGHLIEKNSNFSISHGVAVALGMVSEIKNKEIETKLIDMLKKFSLLNLQIPKIDYLKSLLTDKKANNLGITLIEITTIGKSNIKNYRKDELTNEQFWKEY